MVISGSTADCKFLQVAALLYVAVNGSTADCKMLDTALNESCSKLQEC